MPINNGSVRIGSKENLITGLNVGTILSITLGNTQIKNFLSNGITATFDMPALSGGQQVGRLDVTEATVVGTAGTEQVPCVILPPIGYNKLSVTLDGDGSGTIFEGGLIVPEEGSYIVYPSIIDIDSSGVLISNQYDVDRVYLIMSDGNVEIIDIYTGDGDGLYSFDFDVRTTSDNVIADGLIATMMIINPDGTYRNYRSAVTNGSINFIVGGITTSTAFTVELYIESNPVISAPRHQVTPTKLY